MGALTARLKSRARELKREVLATYLAARDPDTPWYAKALVVLIVAYALSPIDLIPDFIPVLGLVDELVLLPAALALAIRLIPEDVMARARVAAAERASGPPASRVAAGMIILIWLVAIVVMARLMLRWWTAA